jgi:ABC-type multidrug transport system ATPase subunit/pSer/pThr/pTyr-binding forkhead associated (FHA) protein/ABC-type multidrug transport system permease subunit
VICLSCGANAAGPASRCVVCGNGSFAPSVEHSLVAAEAGAGPERIPIGPLGAIVGRMPGDRRIVLDDPEISRTHCTLQFAADGRLHLEDTSANGTFLNDQRVRQGIVNPGDLLRFGNSPSHQFRYELHAVNAAAAAAGRRPSAAPVGTVVMRTPSAAARVGARLQLVLNQYAADEIPLQPPAVQIGRSSGAGRIAIDHPSVGNPHAEIRLTDSGWLLRDLNTGGGTRVNHELIQERLLVEGDLIQLGECESRLLLYREPGSRTLALRDISLNRQVTTIGRDASNDVQLDHPTISRYHAEIHKLNGQFEIVDRGSTNGTFVNGAGIRSRLLKPGDRITVGAVPLVFDGHSIEAQSDGSQMRLSCMQLTKTVADRVSARPLRLLNSISLVIQPRELVGLLGPSGCGKTTLLDALSGSRPADSGKVLLNNWNLYHDFAALRSMLGYVPQEDILHRELTVKSCLYFAARLRLPSDTEDREIAERVQDVLKLLDLGDRAQVPIEQLSGGQRKRVSLGIELLSKPGLLFLDEPTAGQDPRTEMKMMQLFRQIANRGSTVVLTTHLLGSFSLLDKVAVLVRGNLAYFGPGGEMLPYFGQKYPQEIYDTLQNKSPQAWAADFRHSSLYKEFVGSAVEQLGDESERPAAAAVPAMPAQRGSGLRQFSTLLRRQVALRLKNARSYLFALGPPPLVALLVGKMMSLPNDPKTLFMILLSALWFGGSAAVREIVDEDAIYRRERQRNLGLLNYLLSKVLYCAVLGGVQSLLFVSVLTLLNALSAHFLGVFLFMWAISIEGSLIGLLISALASNSQQALAFFPLALIPQLVLAGVFVPVRTIKPFLPKTNSAGELVTNSAGELVMLDLPENAATPAMTYVSPLMVARWGLEGLAELYVHDPIGHSLTSAYPVALVNSVAVTFHSDDAERVRRRLESVNVKDSKSYALLSKSDSVKPALLPYAAILAGFAGLMLVATALAMKRKDE